MQPSDINCINNSPYYRLCIFIHTYNIYCTRDMESLVYSTTIMMIIMAQIHDCEH